MKNIKLKEKELYYRYADQMFQICKRYVNNYQIAEELLNDGFIKIFKNLSKFKPNSNNSLFYWMKKIMINECLMYIRKKDKLIFTNLDDNDLNTSIKMNIDCDYSEIIKIFDLLPLGYRTVFNMYVVDSYSHKEIAQKLGITENTSRSQLTMARKQLRKHLTSIGYAG